MASELLDEPFGYDMHGVHRALVVSERLRVRRRTLNLTQKEVVARLRRLGVTTTNKSLSSLEHGAGLDVGKLPELARALDCTLTYLVGLTDDPKRWEPDNAYWNRLAAPAPPPRPRLGPRSPTPRPAGLPEAACPAILGPLDPPQRRE